MELGIVTFRFALPAIFNQVVEVLTLVPGMQEYHVERNPIITDKFRCRYLYIMVVNICKDHSCAS